MIWNLIIAGLALLAGLFIAYGIYEVVFTRIPHINSWIVRGVVLMVLPVFIYLTYRYTGKIYLTKNLHIVILSVMGMMIFAVFYGILDLWGYRKEIDAVVGDTTYLGELAEKTRKHVNPWRDFQRVFQWIKGRSKAHKEKREEPIKSVSIQKGKKKKKEKKEVVATDTKLIPVNRQAVLNNRTLQTNTMRPRLNSPQLPIRQPIQQQQQAHTIQRPQRPVQPQRSGPLVSQSQGQQPSVPQRNVPRITVKQ